MMRWPEDVERAVRLAIASAVEGTPTVLDIAGQAGYGKSYLARWVARQFPPEQVLRAVAYRSDQADSLGVLRQIDPELPEADANPLRVARAVGRRIDAMQVTGPVAVVVDDLQWADQESIDALGVLLERMAGDRVLVVGARRPRGARSAQWAAQIDAAAAVFRVSLDGLDRESTLQLIRETRADASPELAESLRLHTGGNPLFLRSLLQEHSADELAAMSAQALLPAPRDLIATMNERVAQFDSDSVAVLEALAVLGDGGGDAFVVAAVADVDDAGDALAALRAERLVVVDTDASRRARIFHGVLRAAIYENIPSATRQLMHRRAAARLASPRERLEHRVSAARSVDDGLASDLDGFADELHAQRQFRGAARARRQAAVLSSAPEARFRRERDADFESILALDLDDVAAGDGAAGTDPLTRLTAGARLIAEVRYVAAAETLESLSDDDLEALGEAAAYRARVLRGWAIVSAGRAMHQALSDLETARRSSHQDPALQGYFSIAYGQAAILAAPPSRQPPLDDLIADDRARLASTPAGLARLAWRGSSFALLGLQKVAIPDLEIVTSRLGDGIVDFGDGAFYAFQGLAYFVDGQWGRGSIAFDLARAGRSGPPAPVTSALLPLANVIAGDAEAARSALDSARGVLVLSPQPAAVSASDIVEVLTLALVGTPAERERWLDRRSATFGPPELRPYASSPAMWCVTQAMAASWASRPEVARDAAQLVRDAPSFSWAEPIARWLEARTADDARFVELVEPLSQSGVPDAPLLALLMHLDLAERSSGDVRRDARVRAEQALRAFGGERLLQTIGADDGDEAAPATAASSVLSALSDREREIATLLLEGLSYAQISRELFITRSTVSFHLTRIYAKTGTSSRHELAEATRAGARA